MESTFGKCETGICHEYQNIEIVKIDGKKYVKRKRDGYQHKYCIQFDGDDGCWEVKKENSYALEFATFGYFKEWEDGNKALELFEDEIRRLYGHLIRQRKSLF